MYVCSINYDATLLIAFLTFIIHLSEVNIKKIFYTSCHLNEIRNKPLVSSDYGLFLRKVNSIVNLYEFINQQHNTVQLVMKMIWGVISGDDDLGLRCQADVYYFIRDRQTELCSGDKQNCSFPFRLWIGLDLSAAYCFDILGRSFSHQTS